jgi:hypothetical protein
VEGAPRSSRNSKAEVIAETRYLYEHDLSRAGRGSLPYIK